MDIEDWIRENVKCCACGAKLTTSKYINGICLDKKATWKNNTWGNVLVEGSSGRAIAFVCDECVKKKVLPKYAVEWNDDQSEARYHPVEDLEDVPEITKEQVIEGERKLFFDGK